MHFPTPRVCQAEDHMISARISPPVNEGELLAKMQILGLVEKCEIQGMGAWLDRLCDAFRVVRINSAGRWQIRTLVDDRTACIALSNPP